LNIRKDFNHGFGPNPLEQCSLAHFCWPRAHPAEAPTRPVRHACMPSHHVTAEPPSDHVAHHFPTPPTFSMLPTCATAHPYPLPQLIIGENPHLSSPSTKASSSSRQRRSSVPLPSTVPRSRWMPSRSALCRCPVGVPSQRRVNGWHTPCKLPATRIPSL
jgi:hypothetical protein